MPPPPGNSCKADIYSCPTVGRLSSFNPSKKISCCACLDKFERMLYLGIRSAYLGWLAREKPKSGPRSEGFLKSSSALKNIIFDKCKTPNDSYLLIVFCYRPLNRRVLLKYLSIVSWRHTLRSINEWQNGMNNQGL